MDSVEIIAAFESGTKFPLKPMHGEYFCFDFLNTSQMFRWDAGLENWQSIKPTHNKGGDWTILEQD